MVSSMALRLPNCSTAPRQLRQCSVCVSQPRRAWRTLGPRALDRPLWLYLRSAEQRVRRGKFSCLASQVLRSASFPAGKRQAKVKLPALVLLVTATEVLGSPDSAEQLAAALAGGVTAVLLSDSSSSGGASLYNAALKLKDELRGRAVLLLGDRTDVADAVEADGVVMSSEGLPTLVARRSMQNTAGLVGRTVSSASEAVKAAADGANVVLIEGAKGSCPRPEEVSAAKTQQRSSGKIPIVPLLTGKVSAAVPANADGAAVRLSELQTVAAALGARSSSPAEQAAAILRKVAGNPPEPDTDQRDRPGEPSQREDNDAGQGNGKARGLKQLLGAHQDALLEDERSFLTAAAELLQEVTPQMEERGIVDDALKQLDELFLLVVVGEFNSGKSTIINALLGQRFLADGILPTTNEISILKFAEDGEQRMVQEADGSFVQYIPAPLLEQVNIVDTPGTNVIVERQQRLTEEFVPRADLVLFCLSADRPFTESEVKFLRYIREWGKKVVFVVNKIDILSGAAEEDEVAAFVADSATRMLGVQASQVLPISARKALRSKISGGKDEHSMFENIRRGQTYKDSPLVDDPDFRASRFRGLEKFVFDFLVGTASGGEGARLKLETPLFVSEALMQAARELLAGELNVAQQEAKAARSVKAQLAAFKEDMGKDGSAQRAECRRLINGAVRRAQDLVDQLLQLSNANTLSAYLLGSGSDSRRLPVARAFQTEVVGDSAADLRLLTEEHGGWLRSNCERQLEAYRDFAEDRVRQLSGALAGPSTPSSSQQQPGSNSTADSQQQSSEPQGSGADAAARRAWRKARAVLDEPPPAPSEVASTYSPSTSAIASEAAAQSAALVDSSASSVDTAAAAVAQFEPKAAASLLEEEIREAVVGTVGSAAGAGLFGVVLTWLLPTTLEDLLAASLAGLAGYVALLNLPLKRSEAKGKLQRSADAFLQDIEAKLERELSQGLDACEEEVMGFMRPVEALTHAQVDKLQDALDRLDALFGRLEKLKARAANIE
ncbi:hypothetical protein WJX73_001658 [Symbiochloris irregularis]|uniref:Uncharacterized protein n=1 Tax=Symbiochloris irregularis TaxID=706552 RepID=A0AAW1P569_9CHLO